MALHNSRRLAIVQHIIIYSDDYFAYVVSRAAYINARSEFVPVYRYALQVVIADRSGVQNGFVDSCIIIVDNADVVDQKVKTTA